MSNGDQGSVIAEIEELRAQAEELTSSPEASRSQEHRRWRMRVRALLDRVFGRSSRYSEEFGAIQWSGPTATHLGTNELAYPQDMDDAIAILLAARDEVSRQQDSWGTREDEGTRLPAISEQDARRVFVVHGHDDGAKSAVARFLSSIGLNPVILHEQPDQGLTIIEKFEQYAVVSHAIVLCTGDDEGRKRQTTSDPRPRPRQNVVLELGFFVGKLGRQRVSVLYDEGVEMPSDYAGVLYIPLDGGGQWKVKLARELKSAGVPLDADATLDAL